MKRVGVIICAVLSAAVAAEEVEIPSFLKSCKREAKDYHDCLKGALQDTLAKLAQGYPDLGVPNLDPYVVSDVEAEQRNDLISGKISLKDVAIYGIPKAQILNVRSTVRDDKQHIEVEVLSPRVAVEGKYIAEGRMGDSKLGGKGLFNLTMTGVKVVYNISGTIKNDRLAIEDLTVLPTVKDLKIDFDDVFNGNEALNNVARSFANENWPVVYEAALPVITPVWEKLVTEVLDRLLSKLSYSKLSVKLSG